MAEKRLIEEKYWAHFTLVDPKTNHIKRDGLKFENLVHELLNEMYNGVVINWEPTKLTHDGNKDFKAIYNNEIYWAECKNYENTIDLKTLSATLVMAEVENINVILFFCYSAINNNAKTKLISFSKSTNKTIFFYDGIILDQLILRHREKILPEFFPELNENFKSHKPNEITLDPITLCYIERNPFLEKTSCFEYNDLVELQDLQLGEMVGLHLIVINNNLKEELHCFFDFSIKKSENYFQILDDVHFTQKGIRSKTFTISPGETLHKVFVLKLKTFAPIVTLPIVTCYTHNKKIGNFRFGTIRTLKTRQIGFLGQDYHNKRNELCKNCLNKKELSIALIYGSSGTGKSRMLYECMDRFISAGYQIIKFKTIYTANSFINVLQEIIFSLYGFTEEIIKHIIESDYESLESYKTTKYQSIFKILRNIGATCNSEELTANDYNVLFEKIAQTKCLIMIDDIQYWSDELIEFFQHFISYAYNLQRPCKAVICIVANTDYLYRQSIKEFILQLQSQKDTYQTNIWSYKITGFETTGQAHQFLEESLGVNDTILDMHEINILSLKPKILMEFANYLLDIKAIIIKSDGSLVRDSYLLKQALVDLPSNIYTIIEKRWEIYLRNTDLSSQQYKIIISLILYLGHIDTKYDAPGRKYDAAIINLDKYGFLKKVSKQSDDYVFEHDTIKAFFKTKYNDWIETAILFYKSNKDMPIRPELKKINDIYKCAPIIYDEFKNCMDAIPINDVRLATLMKILQIILRYNKENSFLIIHDIFKDVRENYGEKNAEHFYQLFNEWYAGNSAILSTEQYCSVMMSYAENQVKLKQINTAINLYQKIIECIKQSVDIDAENYLARIYNRFFVCGRVGSYSNKYISQLNQSIKLCRKNQYHDICIENHFDKAQSMMLDNKKKKEILRHLKAGCSACEKYKLNALMGHYYYRSIQILFLESEFYKIPEKLQGFHDLLNTKGTIEYTLFFRIQLLLFKIMFCLIDETNSSDFEICNLLETLNLYQTLQNELQLYRCYYLYGKYYTKKCKWNEAIYFYQKTLETLNKNENTEEIILQKRVIFEDMIICFKKYHFPFETYNLGDLMMVIKELSMEKVIYYSEKEFDIFFSQYCPSAIIATDDKEGYLLF